MGGGQLGSIKSTGCLRETEEEGAGGGIITQGGTLSWEKYDFFLAKLSNIEKCHTALCNFHRRLTPSITVRLHEP